MTRRLAGTCVAVLLLFACGCISLGPFAPPEIEEVLVEESPRWLEVNRVALIDIDGFIASSPTPWFMPGATTVADVREKLDLAAEDYLVRAVVLRINSPGGTATAADTIYREIARFKAETGKPVVAAMGGVAASGGYYVALPADRIIAAPTTVTGSVGVIMKYLNVEGLYGKIGLRSEAIKSGDKKDIASATRPLTPEERKILQNVIDSLYRQFLDAVKAQRTQMTADDAAFIADGRIVTAQEALDHHLVDRIGYLDDALAEARALAGIRTADVILYRAHPDYNANIYAGRPGGAGLVEAGLDMLLRRGSPNFLFLWSPGS